MKFEKGKALPLTQEEKVRLSISYLCRDLGTQESMAYWARDIKITSINSTPMGDNKQRVSAEGSFVLNRRRLSGKNLNLAPLPKSFSVVVEDTRDEWGLPDIVVKSGNVT